MILESTLIAFTTYTSAKARALLLTIPGHGGHVGGKDQKHFSPLGT